MKQSGVYILQSEKDKSYYVGSTDSISERLNQHQRGYVGTTKNKRPLMLRAFLVCNSLTEARQSEYRLKNYKRRDITEKVIQDKVFPWNHKE